MTIFAPIPPPLPEWEVEYELWHGDEPYKIGKIRVSAKTREEARQAIQEVIDELLPHLFPGANIVITTPISLKPPHPLS